MKIFFLFIYLFLHLCFEGLLNISTECAPFICLLQGFCCQLHTTLHFVDLHQDLTNKSHR